MIRFGRAYIKRPQGYKVKYGFVTTPLSTGTSCQIPEQTKGMIGEQLS